MDVFVAYTGARHRVSAVHESLAALAEQVYSCTGVLPDQQLLLVQSSGKRLRLEAVVSEQTVYLYDKSLIRGQLPHSSAPVFDSLAPVPSPSNLDDSSDSSALAHWAREARLCAQEPLTFIQNTRNTIPVILSAASLAEKHLNIHLKSIRNQRDKKSAAYTQICHDLDSCSIWKDSWESYKSVLGLHAKIELLDQTSTSAAWDTAHQIATEVRQMLDDCEIQPAHLPDTPNPATGDEKLLDVDMNALTSKIIDEGGPEPGSAGPSYYEIATEINQVYSDTVQMALDLYQNLVDAQNYLGAVIRQVSQVQTNGARTKAKLNEISQKLHSMDEAKAQVAKVIDFPFIYGVSLIETSRRHSWSAAIEHLKNAALSHFEQLRDNEYRRIDRWTSHYSSLGLIDQLVSVDVKLPTVEMIFDGIQLEDTPDINSYLISLEAAGFGDIVSDLRSERDAMSQQLERSFRATSKTQVLFPDMNASQVIREEQIKDRLRFEVRESIEKELKAAQVPTQVQSVDREAIEREVRAAITQDIRKEMEQQLRSEIAAEYEQQLRSQITAEYEKEQTDKLEKLRADIRSEVEAEYLAQELARAQSEEHTQDQAPAKPMQDSYIQELQNQINQLQNSDAQKWVDSLVEKTHDLSQRLYANSHHLEIVLEMMGLRTVRKADGEMVSYEIERVHGMSRRPSQPDANVSTSSMVLGGETVPPVPRIPDPSLLNWVFSPNNDDDFRVFLQEIYIDYDIFRQVVCDRFSEVEKIARKYYSQVKSNRERIRELERSVRHRLALNQFKVGDLILFLPTRDSVRIPNPWAAFNVNSPQYFLDPENARQLGNREFVVGRATAIVQHKVEPGDSPEANPFSLPEGLVWNMITAQWK